MPKVLGEVYFIMPFKEMFMKYLYCLVLSTAFAAMVSAQTAYLKITPEHPKPGETIVVEYNLAASPLSTATESIDIAALEFVDKTPQAKNVMLQNVGGKLKGQFTLSQDALVALLVFQAGERQDNNNGEGYFIQVSDAAGNPNPQSLAAQAVLYRDWGGLFELNRKTTVAFDLLSRAFVQKPSLRQQYYVPYISNLMAIKRGDAGKAEALAVLESVEQSPGLDEKDWIAIARMYERLSVQEKADAVKATIRKTYPKGAFIRQEQRQAMRNEPDLAKHQSLIEAYARNFPPTNDDERAETDDLYLTLANKAAEKKDWDLMNKIAPGLRANNRASLYNNVAWELAQNDEELEMARKMAAEATTWAQNEITNPQQEKPGYLTQKNWEKQRKYTFAQNADTYAYVLDKLNDPQSASFYQGRAVEATDGDSPDMNERYTAYLERSGAPDLRYRLEGFILHNQSTGPMKDQFKRLYASEDKSTAGAEAYLAGLENIARINRKKEIAAKILDQPAPEFSLKNLNGEEVSLASLKGKIVVIDFWATWCGPCKMSFPGMQQTVDKFKSDPEVAFVFVDTWERVDDKAKAAGDFIASKNYTFNVLLDTENSVVASFGVSGIPTKFIVDPNGKIRFKSVGYAGSTDALVDELITMIELVKEQP